MDRTSKQQSFESLSFLSVFLLQCVLGTVIFLTSSSLVPLARDFFALIDAYPMMLKDIRCWLSLIVLASWFGMALCFGVLFQAGNRYLVNYVFTGKP